MSDSNRRGLSSLDYRAYGGSRTPDIKITNLAFWPSELRRLIRFPFPIPDSPGVSTTTTVGTFVSSGQTMTIWTNQNKIFLSIISTITINMLHVQRHPFGVRIRFTPSTSGTPGIILSKQIPSHMFANLIVSANTALHPELPSFNIFAVPLLDTNSCAFRRCRPSTFDTKEGTLLFQLKWPPIKKFTTHATACI